MKPLTPMLGQGPSLTVDPLVTLAAVSPMPIGKSPEPTGRRGPCPKGTRLAMKKGSAAYAITEALSQAQKPMTFRELVAVTGKPSGGVAVALNYGVKNGDFVRIGAGKPYAYQLREAA